MVRIGCPEDVSAYYFTDDPDVVFRLHQAGFHPAWKDEQCIYFKKNNKLLKMLKKLDIDVE